jgi:predicted amino acid dehydrogenase
MSSTTQVTGRWTSSCARTQFDASRFARREVVEIAGVELYAATAEDILITKLWWAKLSESERQIADAAGVLSVQGENLQKSYVERWVSILDLDDQWQAARKKAV